MEKKVKLLLGDAVASRELILLMLDISIDMIRRYCNISHLSRELENVACMITAEAIKQLANNEKRVSRGDTNVEFFSPNELESFIYDYRNILNLHRRLKF